MKMNLLITFIALAASGCVNLRTPDGYAKMERSGGYDYKAVSTDAAVIALRVHRNADKEQGTLAYWTTASTKHLTLSRGYTLREEGDFVSNKGPGKWLLFTKKHKGTDYLYLLGLVVKGRKIFALEAGGEAEVFEADVPRVVKAFASLD